MGADGVESGGSAGPGLSAADYARIKVLFVELCDLPESERAARLDRLEFPALRAALEAMLGADGDGGVLPDLDGRASGASSRRGTGGRREESGGAEHLPEWVGQYRIVRLLGEGGMGRVYEAAQEFPNRAVALKVIRFGSMGSSLLRRFQQEVDVLARLRHPGIAQIYEAGKAEIAGQEQPYFAMELVTGLPLTRHVEQRSLDLRARLELFVKVCDAVQHAHERGVVHRDLKPGNILVVEGEAGTATRTRGGRTGAGGSQPKILDFGIARLTESAGRGLTVQTSVGQLIGTVPYMSPEQVAGHGHELDARSDVYALGVIVYELVSGRLPHQFGNASLAEVARMIRDEDPPPLSTVTAGRSGPVRGDLETIVAKALAKEPERRYESAAALAQDIQRYLDHEPILARRASAAYHLRKFAERNRRLTAVLAAFLVVLIVSAVGGPILYLRAEAARRLADSRRITAEDAFKEAGLRRAEAEKARDAADASNKAAVREARRSKTMSDFVLHDILESAEPTADKPEIKLIDVLASASVNAKERLKDEPAIEFAIHDALSTTYQILGEPDLAYEQADLALACARASGSDAPVFEIYAQQHRAWSLHLKGDNARAEALLRDALDQALRTLPADSVAIVRVRFSLGELLQEARKFDEAETLLRAGLAVAEHPGAQGGELNDEVFLGLSALSGLLVAQGRFGKAEPVIQKFVALSKSRPRGADAAASVALNQMATFLTTSGHADRALPVAMEASAIAHRVFPTRSLGRAYTTEGVAVALARLYRFEEARPLAQQAYEEFVAAEGDDRFEVERAARWVGIADECTARLVEADSWYRRYVVLRFRIAGPNEGLSVCGALFDYEDQLKRFWGGAVATGATCGLADEIERVAPPGHRSRARALANLGRALTASGRYDEAEPLLLEAYAALPRAGTPGEDYPLVLSALADLYDRLHQPEAAAAWRARVTESAPASHG